MASTVLPNGIIIPEKYSRDWYADLYHNWQELDNLLAGGTPKDGTLTIQKNGTTVGTFSANQATDETVNIEVPAVNDGTLTIQQNGTTVDSFTANSSTDKTVNISVPTATSELTNDSGFITEDTTKIPLSGSNAISGSLIPATTDAYDLGSSSYQWNNAYIKSLTINGVACGDILTHNVSEFVNVTGAQTIDGQKTFTASPRVIRTFPAIMLNISDCDVTKTPTEAKFATLYFRDKNNKNLAYIEAQQRLDGKKRMCIRTHRTDNINNYYSVDLDSDGDFYPEQNNGMNLGTSVLKWKSVYTNAINGLNPGALSLPSSTVSMNLIGDVSVVGTEKKLSKDITVTGYIYADVSFTSSNRLNLYNDTKKYGICMPCDSGRIRQIMPISAGDRLEFNVLDNGSTVNVIQLFACQGNV